MQMNGKESGERAIDLFLLGLDEGVIGAAYRGLIGFVLIPAKQLLMGSQGSDWSIVPFLLIILFVLRLVPALVRKLLPFSAELKEAWFVRRRTAKLYDSYQWRKVTWIGAGLLFYVAVSRQFSTVYISLSVLCLIAGAGAALRWRAILADDRFPKPVARKIKHFA